MAAGDCDTRSALTGIEGAIHLEFIVPRLGSRIDAVVISGPALFVIEFKVGRARFRSADLNQAWDYALDLKNFHSGSHHASIIPILVATEAASSDDGPSAPHATVSTRLRRCDQRRLRNLVLTVWRSSGRGHRRDHGPERRIARRRPSSKPPVRSSPATRSRRSPDTTPALRNLHVTSPRVEQVIERARAEAKGHRLRHRRPRRREDPRRPQRRHQTRDAAAATHAVFLSGNGPLVAVLREALTRDEQAPETPA